MNSMLFAIQIDCESTQRSIADADLGARAVRGIADILDHEGLRATFMVIPPDMEAHAALYREMRGAGHEVGLHIHPGEQGYQEFLGVYGPDEQTRIIREGMDVFSGCMDGPPRAFTPGYCSANDHTFGVLESLGFTHGTVYMPTRNLPQCASVWGDSPLGAHYPHRHNRCLCGDVDFVDVPPTVDTASRMWGGAHPQDLRIELVDAKNHWYTINKSVARQQGDEGAAGVRYIKAITHNIFDYSDPRDFRRETLLGVIAAARSICEDQGFELVGSTTEGIAERYRASIALPREEVSLELDTRGRQGWKGNRDG